MLYLACVHSGNNTDNGIAKLLDETSIQFIGKSVRYFSHLMKSDSIAIGSSKEFSIEDNKGCDAHDG